MLLERSGASIIAHARSSILGDRRSGVPVAGLIPSKSYVL
jgi:hypothetical protein